MGTAPRFPGGGTDAGLCIYADFKTSSSNPLLFSAEKYITDGKFTRACKVHAQATGSASVGAGTFVIVGTTSLVVVTGNTINYEGDLDVSPGDEISIRIEGNNAGYGKLILTIQ